MGQMPGQVGILTAKTKPVEERGVAPPPLFTNPATQYHSANDLALRKETHDAR